jgi:small subunit ribosomal protein S1
VLDENDEPFVKPGMVLEATVVDPRPDGPRFSVSRRAFLEEQRRSAQAEAASRVVAGAEVDGTVSGFNRHGAVIDLGGLEGFVHVSELAWRRVERAEDAVQLGERVRVRVLSIEDSDRGPRVRLSLRALTAPEPAQAPPAPEEVLKAKVVASVGGGITVTTPKGDGFIRLADLGLPPGADHRRAYPAGKELDVVLLTNAGGRLRFSATQVARVEERKNFRDYSSGGSAQAGFGNLGDILRERLGLPAAEPEAPSAPPAAVSPGSPAPAQQRATAAAAPAEPPRAVAPPAKVQPAPAPRPPAPRNEPPDGVVRRKRP